MKQSLYLLVGLSLSVALASCTTTQLMMPDTAQFGVSNIDTISLSEPLIKSDISQQPEHKYYIKKYGETSNITPQDGMPQVGVTDDRTPQDDMPQHGMKKK